MALSSFVGNFTTNTVTGNQAITGVGFTPKIVLFFPTLNTAAGLTDGFSAGFGAGISSTNRRCIGFKSQDGVTTTNPDSRQDNTKCFTLLDPNTGVLAAADLVSLDADGFTVNITTAPASGRLVGYLALGGDDMSNVGSGQFLGSASVGNQAVTGVGFQPDCVIFFTMADDNAPPSDRVNTEGVMGFATSSTARGVTQLWDRNGQTTSETSNYQRTVRCISAMTNADAIFYEADFVSFDADGFTVNWITAGDGARYIHYVAFKGGQYFAGSFNSQTATGNFSVTGTGFQPTGVIFMSMLNAAATTVQQGMQYSLGAASSSTARFATFGDSEDAVTTTDTDTAFSATRVYLNYDFAQTLEGDADFVSFDSDGFTLNQTDADPTGNQVLYLAFGNTASATSPVNLVPLMGVG